MTEHLPHVEQPLATIVSQIMLNRRTNHARRVLGPKRELLPIEAVNKGVHLLFNNVSGLTRAANEKCRGLHDRSADIAIGVACHQCAYLVLKPFPTRGIWRQDVIHALNRS